MKYDSHPCLICGNLTENKTYCNTRLAVIKRPRFAAKSSRLIHAEIEPSSSGRRKFNEHELRG